MKRRTILAICLVIAALIMLALWRLADQDLDHRASETFEIGIAAQRRSSVETSSFPPFEQSAALFVFSSTATRTRVVPTNRLCLPAGS